MEETVVWEGCGGESVQRDAKTRMLLGSGSSKIGEGTAGERPAKKAAPGYLHALCLNCLPVLWLPDGLLDRGGCRAVADGATVGRESDSGSENGRVGGDVVSKTSKATGRKQTHITTRASN
jgi:hypothetical protein